MNFSIKMSVHPVRIVKIEMDFKMSAHPVRIVKIEMNFKMSVHSVRIMKIEMDFKVIANNVELFYEEMNQVLNLLMRMIIPAVAVQICSLIFKILELMFVIIIVIAWIEILSPLI